MIATETTSWGFLPKHISDNVSSNLSRSDLRSCALVNREWGQSSRQKLARSVDLQFLKVTKPARDFRKLADQWTARSRSFISSLHLTDSDDVNTIFRKAVTQPRFWFFHFQLRNTERAAYPFVSLTVQRQLSLLQKYGLPNAEAKHMTRRIESLRHRKDFQALRTFKKTVMHLALWTATGFRPLMFWALPPIAWPVNLGAPLRFGFLTATLPRTTQIGVRIWAILLSSVSIAVPAARGTLTVQSYFLRPLKSSSVFSKVWNAVDRTIVAVTILEFVSHCCFTIRALYFQKWCGLPKLDENVMEFGLLVNGSRGTSFTDATTECQKDFSSVSTSFVHCEKYRQVRRLSLPHVASQTLSPHSYRDLPTVLGPSTIGRIISRIGVYLTYLDFSFNLVNDACVEIIAQECTQLNTLRLQGCCGCPLSFLPQQMTYQGFMTEASGATLALSDMLRKNQALQTVDFSGCLRNRFPVESAVPSVKAGVVPLTNTVTLCRVVAAMVAAMAADEKQGRFVYASGPALPPGVASDFEAYFGCNPSPVVRICYSHADYNDRLAIHPARQVLLMDS